MSKKTKMETLKSQFLKSNVFNTQTQTTEISTGKWKQKLRSTGFATLFTMLGAGSFYGYTQYTDQDSRVLKIEQSPKIVKDLKKVSEKTQIETKSVKATAHTSQSKVSGKKSQKKNNAHIASKTKSKKKTTVSKKSSGSKSKKIAAHKSKSKKTVHNKKSIAAK